jgi:nitrogen fixation/metabolism regulation signal transduction histidine kinase
VSFKQKLFTSFLVLAFLPTAALLLFSYRLATQGVDLLAARGVSQTIGAADSLALSVVAHEQRRLQSDGRQLSHLSSTDVRRLVEADSQFAFVMIAQAGGDSLAFGDVPRELQATHAGALIRDFEGRLIIGTRLLIWETTRTESVTVCFGRFLPGDYFSLASRVMDGKARFVSLSKNLLPGGRNLLLKITVALIVASLILSLVAAQSLSYGFSAPLERLVDATRRVSFGDLKCRIPLGRRDEIGTLIDHFNTMTESLESVTQSLIAAEKEMTWRENARTVAHEIKNLLTPVNVALYQIKKRLLTDPGGDSQLNREVDALTAEIDAIADLARQFALFAHPAKLAPTEIGLQGIVNQVVALYFEAAHGRSITVSIEPAAMTIHADPDLLRRVVSNLLKNAIEATSDNGRITIAATDNGDNCILEVIDDGKGADETLDLTQPYLTTKKSGTGLGLAIVKKVCDAHGWAFSYGNLNPGFSARIMMGKKQ